MSNSFDDESIEQAFQIMPKKVSLHPTCATSVMRAKFSKISTILVEPNILFQDTHLIALHKPSGMEVHRHTQGHRSRQPYLMQWARELSGTYVYPVHRLDRSASGVVLFALTKDSAKKLQDEWLDSTIKVYHAIVRGHFPDYEKIDRPLQTAKYLSKTKDPLPSDNPFPLKPATTEVRTLSRSELPWVNRRHSTSRYSLVEARPHTGRFHQIRRHLSFRGYPIIGDRVHGDGEHNRLVENHTEQRRLYLHAFEIKLKHPVSHELIKISAPFDQKWNQSLTALQLRTKSN